MSIIRQLTEAEADLAWKDSLVLRVAEAANHLASVMTSVHAEFHSKLPPERLVAVLNDDVPASLAMLQGNTEIGTPICNWLDELGEDCFSARPPLTMGRADIVFDGTAFVYVAPTEPEPE